MRFSVLYEFACALPAPTSASCRARFEVNKESKIKGLSYFLQHQQSAKKRPFKIDPAFLENTWNQQTARQKP